MQKDYSDKEFDAIFESMKGSQRAKPNPELFGKIEAQIDRPEAKIVSMRFQQLAVATVVLLLMMNVFVLQQFSKNNASFAGEQMNSETQGQSLISNYKIYE